MALYELAILGAATTDERALLSATIAELVQPFELAIGAEVAIHDAASLDRRDKGSACAAAFFGGLAHSDVEAVEGLLRANVPVIPTVKSGTDFSSNVPSILHALNGLSRRVDDRSMSELAVAMLECVGLLRRQRRAFVSYRRLESRVAAVQLHDMLTERAFDVFLDTHDIRPGEPFQEVLWHRLVDSDVVVMLDTPTFFEGRWTREEIGRARAKDIQVLRVIWPAHTPTKLTDFSETIYLQESDLHGAEGPIINSRAEEILLCVERLRSRSIAARYMAITGKLRADVEKIGGNVKGIGAHRAVAVQLLDDRRIWAYPIVGIPTAELLNDVVDKATSAGHGETPVVVYDHVGIRDAWLAHLRWLDENISCVRAIKVSEAGWTLAGWDGA